MSFLFLPDLVTGPPAGDPAAGGVRSGDEGTLDAGGAGPVRLSLLFFLGFSGGMRFLSFKTEALLAAESRRGFEVLGFRGGGGMGLLAALKFSLVNPILSSSAADLLLGLSMSGKPARRTKNPTRFMVAIWDECISNGPFVYLNFTCSSNLKPKLVM